MPNKVQAKTYLEDNNYPTEFNDEGKEAFLKACKQGETEIVEAYIDLGFPLDYQHRSNGVTPLVCATEANRIEIIEILLEAGADIEYLDGDKDTALMTAINWQKTQAVTTLIEAGANVNLLNKNNWAPITRSIHLKNQRLFDILIQVPDIDINLGADLQISAFHFAFRSSMNSFQNCKKILEKGFDPNILQNKDTQSSFLIKAVIHERSLVEKKELIELLLNHGSDINHQDINGETAWSHALDDNYQELATWLVSKGAIIDKAKAPFLGFMNAIKDNDIAKVREYLSTSLDINQPNSNNKDKTALMWAAHKGHSDICQLLIAHGAEVDSIDKNQWTALSYTTFYNSPKCFDLLIEAGANPNDQPNYSRSLINACRKNHLAMAKTLLDEGADVDSVDTRQQSSLALAASKGYLALVELLLKYKPNLELPTEKGSTALGAAAYNNQVEIVKVLIKAGAILDLQDNEQNTALMKVCDKYSNYQDPKQATIARLLLQAGADYTIGNQWHANPLQVARSQKHSKCIKVLEDWLTEGIFKQFKKQYGWKGNDADLDSDFYKTFAQTQNTETLKEWIRKDDYHMIEQLLKAGLSPNPEVANHETPIGTAIIKLKPKILTLLLQYGANPDQANKYDTLPIFTAAQKGDSSITKALLEHGTTANIVDSKGFYPLHKAIISNSLDVVRTLFLVYPQAALEKSPVVLAASRFKQEILRWLIESVCLYIDSVDDEGNTALLKAIKNKEKEVPSYLIRQGANVNMVNNAFETPLYLACINNDTDLAEQLLEAGADPLYKQKGVSISKAIGNRRKLKKLLQQYSSTPIEAKGIEAKPITKSPVSPLFKAVYTRNLELLRVLIDQKVDVNQINYRGDTPLMMAAARGYMDIVEELINAGAAIETKNEWQDTAWTYSVLVSNSSFFDRNNNQPASKTYKKLDKTLDANQQAKLYLRVDDFRAALNKSDFRKINDIINQKSMSVNCLDASNTPLTRAILRKDANIVEFLLQKGADPNIPNGYGQTPIHLVILHKTQDILELLLEYKADTNIKTDNHTSPLLQVAIKQNLSAFVYLLLKAGADPKLENDEGLDAYAVAKNIGNNTIIQQLNDFRK
ncbi:MAG: hypothetical protein GY810_19135 [Aureispira sp.]|nr:hypothetical protein [Aureispira sp.]